MRVTVYESLPQAGPERAGHRRFEIRPAAGGAYRLELEGRLGLWFAEPLCRGLARAGLDVRVGCARRTAEHDWRVNFELVRQPGSLDPLGIDYLELSSLGAQRGLADRADLESFSLADSDRHGGSLCLEVVARDRVGFLGGLLERLAATALVPVEMRIWTDDRGVTDRFYLQTEAGDAPDARTRERLAVLLGPHESGAAPA